jgi:hypothetical protein
MTTLTDQIDRFVRWFFNSSPDSMSIEPRPSKPATKPAVAPRGRATSKRPPGDRRSSKARQEVRVRP